MVVRWRCALGPGLGPGTETETGTEAGPAGVVAGCRLSRYRLPATGLSDYRGRAQIWFCWLGSVLAQVSTMTGVRSAVCDA